MPSGFSGVREAAADIKARKEAGGTGTGLWLKLADGDKATVRFLEQGDDINWCWMHKVPASEKQRWPGDEPCPEQNREGVPCPACMTEGTVVDNGKPKKIKDRSFKGFINVIWDEAPVFKRDDEGRIVKGDDNKPIITDRKPQVALWEQGITTFTELDGIDATFKGLRSRKFVIKRTGTGLSTKYSIMPLDPDSGPQPFSDEEKKLDSEKPDLKEKTTPKSAEDLDRLVRGVAAAPATDTNGNRTDVDDVTPFM